MVDILKLLRDAVGLRPLVPLLLIIGVGYLFKSVRDYPIRELVYDRYYLLSVLAILSITVGYVIFTSTLAQRTAEGRFGVYVARFTGDVDTSLTTRVIEGLTATLDGKARDAQIRLEVRDLKREVADQEGDQYLLQQTRQLNAAAVVWGRAIDKSSVYVRLWTEGAGLVRSPEPVNVTDITALAKLASDVWDRIELTRRNREKAGDRSANSGVDSEVSRLRTEVAELRSIVTTSLVSRSASASTTAASLNPSAILVGISAYPEFPLNGPVNDVNALQQALRARGNWRINTLLDRDATRAKIEDTIVKAAAATPPAETLLVFLSGHGSVEKNATYFIPYDFDTKNFANGVDLRDLITKTLKTHERTVFIIDSPFDPSKLGPEQVRAAAVLTAGARSDAVLEVHVGGKAMGAFTVAVVQALTSAAPDARVPVMDLYATVRTLLRDRREGTDLKPLLLAGPDAPAL